MNGSIALDPGASRGTALSAVRHAFAQAGLDEPALDARILVAEAAGIRPGLLLADLDRPLGAEATARLSGFAARRLAHEPVWRVLGTAEFWGLPFRLAPETLVPRPDTETLVETALALMPGPATRILDLGTGSGCVLVALLSECRDAFGIGLDRSEAACRTARENAGLNGVASRAAFLVGDWTAALAPEPGFGLVVSNPPYIPAADLPSLPRGGRAKDPARGLDGGPDGLDAYRAILARGRDLRAPGGVLAVEVGIGQAEPVAQLGETHGLVFLRLSRDLAGIPRVVAFGR
ncbi:MAG: peptide chain release factor N(5)-glutamine methyltransferase [Salinarimonas sp.]